MKPRLWPLAVALLAAAPAKAEILKGALIVRGAEMS
jgi:hypothetical protein